MKIQHEVFEIVTQSVLISLQELFTAWFDT